VNAAVPPRPPRLGSGIGALGSCAFFTFGLLSSASRAFSSSFIIDWRMSSRRPLARLKSRGGVHALLSLKTK